MADTYLAAKDKAAVTLLADVRAIMGHWPRPEEMDGRIVVPTHCLYASGGLVKVHVEPRMGAFVVHDQGRAIDEFASNGGQLENAVTIIRRALNPRGFVIPDSGAIYSPQVNLEEIPPAVAQVANASKDMADYLGGQWKPVVKRDFKRALRDLIEREFPHLHAHPSRLAGKSTRQHQFDFAINLREGGLLLIDGVTHDASAINATVIRNLDVRGQAGQVEQRIIFDDDEEWPASDLNLLSMGATPIPFSEARDVLARLAA